MALILNYSEAQNNQKQDFFNVKNYGAVGDGIHLDTEAINAAITAAGNAGGGTVYFPAGKYLSFSIHLISNLTLFIDQGSTIVAANMDEHDGKYDAPEPNIWGDSLKYQDFGHSHFHNSLIWGENLENISIIGSGLIYGKGLQKWGRPTPGLGNKSIALKLCKNVLLRDFSILHGGHFGVLATGVDNLTISNLKVDTNRDGFDIDCCRQVRISDCSVNAPNDDAIVLKSSYALGYAAPTENKADYWDVWSDMFGEIFFKVQADWCSENNLEYMVHLNHEEKMMDLARSSGDFFENLRHVQIPGIDAIWNQIWPDVVADFPKYASSVSHVYGKKQALSESFAAYRTRPNLAQAKWVVDHQLVRGINLFEFMYWASSASGRENPSGWMAEPGFPDFINYTNRMSYLLSEGKPTATIAVYYPTSSLWLGNKNSDEQTLKIAQQLLENQRDFDFIDEYSLNNVLELSGSGFKNLSGQVYTCVIVPPLKVISKAMIEKLHQFSVGGGKVVFMEEQPTLLVDGVFKNAEKYEELDWPIKETETILSEKVKQNLPSPDLWLEAANPAIKYNHRKINGAELYFVFNEREENTEVKINVQSVGKVQEWNALNSVISEVESTHVSKNQIRFYVTLQAWETKVFVVGKMK